MATAKKKTATKKVNSSKTRPTTTRKAPAKKKATTTTTVKSTSARTARAKQPKSTFLTMTPTTETVYWGILGVVVILLAIWVLSLTAKIDNIYNQINVQNASDSFVVPKPIKHKN